MLKASAKRVRSWVLTGEPETAASRASLRRTYSVRDRPRRRAWAYSAAMTSSGTSRISMSVIAASQLISRDIAPGCCRAAREHRLRLYVCLV